jgi:hypothetical protein
MHDRANAEQAKGATRTAQGRPCAGARTRDISPSCRCSCCSSRPVVAQCTAAVPSALALAMRWPAASYAMSSTCSSSAERGRCLNAFAQLVSGAQMRVVCSSSAARGRCSKAHCGSRCPGAYSEGGARMSESCRNAGEFCPLGGRDLFPCPGTCTGPTAQCLIHARESGTAACTTWHSCCASPLCSVCVTQEVALVAHEKGVGSGAIHCTVTSCMHACSAAEARPQYTPECGLRRRRSEGVQAARNVPECDVRVRRRHTSSECGVRVCRRRPAHTSHCRMLPSMLPVMMRSQPKLKCAPHTCMHVARNCTTRLHACRHAPACIPPTPLLRLHAAPLHSSHGAARPHMHAPCHACMLQILRCRPRAHAQCHPHG